MEGRCEGGFAFGAGSVYPGGAVGVKWLNEV